MAHKTRNKAPMKNSRILIISYRYLPDISPRAFRWAAIAEYWAAQGYQVDIVCGSKPDLPSEEIVEGVSIHRIGLISIEFLRKKLNPKASIVQGHNKSRRELKGHGYRQKIRHSIKWFHDHSWKKIYWPDSACLWYFSAKKKAHRLLKTHHYDGIISVSHPFTSHLVGVSLKKGYPHIPWVMDFGDPFCFYDVISLNNQKLYCNFNYFIERKMFKLANAISVTTQGTMAKYAEIFPENASKIRVIPPLRSINENQVSKDSVFPSDQKIRLIFIGSLNKTIRSPDFLLRLFGKLLQTYLGDRLELHFFGRINDCYFCFKEYEALLDRKIFLHGQVSHDTALQAMRDANILINIGNSTPYQLPSKVVEYAGMGKPILNLTRIKHDSSAVFLKEYPALLCFQYNGKYPDSHQFDMLVQFIENPPQVDTDTLGLWRSAFQVETIAVAYENLLKYNN